MNSKKSWVVVMLALAVCGWAAPPGLVTKVLLRTGLTSDESREVLVVSGELASGGIVPWHSHPGDEYGTVLHGSIEIRVSGQKTGRPYGAGESYHNASGIVHETRNAGEETAQLLSTFVLEKGKPMISPADERSASQPPAFSSSRTRL